MYKDIMSVAVGISTDDYAKHFDWKMYNSRIKTKAISGLEDSMIQLIRVMESMLSYYSFSLPKINLLANIINNLTGITKDIDTFHHTIMNIDTLKSVGVAFTGTVKDLSVAAIKLSQIARGLHTNFRMLYASTFSLEVKKAKGVVNPVSLMKSSASIDLISNITSDPSYISEAQQILILAREIDNMMAEFSIQSKEAFTKLGTVYEIMKMTIDEFGEDKRNRIEDSTKKTIAREFSNMMPHVKKYVSAVIQHDKMISSLYNQKFREAWKAYSDENSFDPAFNVKHLVNSADPEDIILAATKIRNALGIQVAAAQKELDDLERSSENTFNIKIAGVSDPEYARFRAYNIAIKDLQTGRERGLKLAIDGLTKCVSLGDDQIDTCIRKLPKVAGRSDKSGVRQYIGAVKHVDALRDNVQLQKRIIEALKAAAKNPDLDKPTAATVDGFVEKQFQVESTRELSGKLNLASKVMHEESIDDLQTFDKKINAEINHLKNQKNINRSFIDQVMNASDIDDISIAASGAYGTAFSVPFEYYGGCLTCGGKKRKASNVSGASGASGGGKGRVSSNLFVKDDNRKFVFNGANVLFMTPEENKAYAEKVAEKEFFPQLLEARNQLERGLIDKKIAATMFERIRGQMMQRIHEIRDNYYNTKPADIPTILRKVHDQNKKIVRLRIIKTISKYATYIKLTLESFLRILNESNILVFQVIPDKVVAKKVIDDFYVFARKMIDMVDKINFASLVSEDASSDMKVLYNMFTYPARDLVKGSDGLNGIFSAAPNEIERLLDIFIAAHFRKMGKSYDGSAEKVFKAFKGLPIYKLISNLNYNKLGYDDADINMIINPPAADAFPGNDAKQYYIMLKYRTSKLIKYFNNCEFILKSIFKLLCNMDFVQICVAMKFAILYNRGQRPLDVVTKLPYEKVNMIMTRYTAMLDAVGDLH